jgi:UDP-glucose-4-epimerase GalE
MTIALITGGAGYLGTHLAKALKQAGYTTICYDFKSTDCQYYDFRYRGDVRNLDRLEYVFNNIKKIDVVFHLAGRIEVGHSWNEPEEFWSTNVGGTCNVLKMMRQYGVKNIVYSSTAAVYETSNGALTEIDSIALNNPYARTKYAAETAIQDSGLNAVIFRYFNLAGADPECEMGEDHNPETHLIPLFFKNLNNFAINGNDYDTHDGTCVRDYVHVSDVADAHVLAAKYLETNDGVRILNLGTGIGCSILNIIQLTVEHLKLSSAYHFVERRKGDPDSLVADISLAKEVLNYNPKHDIVSILKTAYAWTNKHNEEKTNSNEYR